MQEDKYPIIIIQHAHMNCTEVIRQIFAKGFDLLVIDESFIDSLTVEMRPTNKEIEILQDLKIDWLSPLLNWMEGGKYPGPKIKPLRDDLKAVLEAFKKEGIPYRLDNFLRQYNDGEFMDKHLGVMKFNPVPECTVRLLTDATPTIEELQIVLDNPNIVRVGGNFVLDPQIYHPESKTYQVLDGTASWKKMIQEEELYDYLEWACDLMRGKYKDLTGLFTVKKEAEQDTWDWIIRNYPEVVPRIQVNHMAVGTNEWANFNVQFIFAAPYVNYKQLSEQVYRLKFIKNYWAKINDQKVIPNPHYGNLLSTSQGDKPNWKPIYRIHKDGKFEYPQYHYPESKDQFEGYVLKRLLNQVFQSNRIRDRQGKISIRYFLDNRPMAKALIHSNTTKAELIGRLD
jgi:hypothetical protein